MPAQVDRRITKTHEIFVKDVVSGTALGKVARLDTMVTVVDANQFVDDYGGGQTLVCKMYL